jgi:tetratricopeptide (TPR) repeat protein
MLRPAALLSFAVILAFGALFGACASPETRTVPSSSSFADLDAGIAFWHDRAEADPADFVSRTRLGNLYYQRARLSGDIADYQRAGEAYQAARDAHPTESIDAMIGLGFVATARHEFEQAISLANAVLALDPFEAAGLAIRGDARVAIGDYSGARDDYALLVERAPGLASHARMAILQAMLGDVAGAELSWTLALADPNASAADTAWALSEFGHFQFSLGNLSGARLQYARSLDLVPGYLPGELGLADVHAAEGDLERAIRAYQLAVNRAPAPETALKLGDLLTAAGRPDDAAEHYALVEAFEKLFAANGITTDITMIHFLAERGRADEAIARARQLYGSRPGLYSADALAWSLHKAGRSAEAMPYAAEATRFGTPDARLYYHAGAIAAAAGDPARGAELLAAAIALNPHFSPTDGPAAARLLAKLTSRAEAPR